MEGAEVQKESEDQKAQREDDESRNFPELKGTKTHIQKDPEREITEQEEPTFTTDTLDFEDGERHSFITKANAARGFHPLEKWDWSRWRLHCICYAGKK